MRFPCPRANLLFLAAEWITASLKVVFSGPKISEFQYNPALKFWSLFTYSIHRFSEDPLHGKQYE